MKHKLRIFTQRHIRSRWRWYVECECGWEPERSRHTGLYARDHFDTALVTGIVHQKEIRDAHLAQ